MTLPATFVLLASLLFLASLQCWRQCCGTGMFIPDPGSGFFRPESGSGGLYFSCCRHILYYIMRHIRLSDYLDYGYRTVIFFCYPTIGMSNIGLGKCKNCRTFGHRTPRKLSAAELWYIFKYFTNCSYALLSLSLESRIKNYGNDV
jgi:hypothetical protein